MAKRLRLKKVTLRDVGDDALKHVVGGDDTVFSCASHCTCNTCFTCEASECGTSCGNSACGTCASQCPPCGTGSPSQCVSVCIGCNC